MDSVTSGLEKREFGKPWATAATRTILTNAPRNLAANEVARGNKIIVLRDKRRIDRQDAAVRPVPWDAMTIVRSRKGIPEAGRTIMADKRMKTDFS